MQYPTPFVRRTSIEKMRVMMQSAFTAVTSALKAPGIRFSHEYINRIAAHTPVTTVSARDHHEVHRVMLTDGVLAARTLNVPYLRFRQVQHAPVRLWNVIPTHYACFLSCVGNGTVLVSESDGFGMRSATSADMPFTGSK
jgi:hypothetical protein